MCRSSAANKWGQALAAVLLAAMTCVAPARMRPLYGGTLRVETLADPWQAADSLGRKLVYDSLTSVDIAGTVQPALALRWTSQNSDQRWQFWIRPGVKFHDGSSLTAESVQASLGRSCTQCPWATVKVVGNSVVFTTTSPDPVLPAELARGLYAIAGNEIAGVAAGTGGFRFVSNENNLLTLTAVDEAWQGRPFVDKVQIFGRRVLRTQWLDLASGQADLVDVPVESLRQAQQEHMKVMQTGACDLLVLEVSRKAPLADDAQREAIALAVDRAALANVIFQKQAEVTASLLPNSLTGYSFLFPVDRDLARSQAVRGGGTGATLTLRVDDTNAAVRLAADRIALNLREAGFRVTVTSGPGGLGAASDLVLRRIHLLHADPQTALQQMLGEFRQPLTEEGGDPATLYREEAAFLQTHEAVPLLYLPRAYGVGPRVRGLRLSADGLPDLGEASLEDVK